jgi:DNA topoisomerase-1
MHLTTVDHAEHFEKRRRAESSRHCGRKQSRYHPRWREVRDATKYERMLSFGVVLPGIRERVERDISQSGLSQSKVLATVVRLMETTCIRVGNTEYARKNHSYGLTTMRNRHVRIDGANGTFRFEGKSGVEHVVDVHDRRLAKIIQKCQDSPGYELFQYVDEGANDTPSIRRRKHVPARDQRSRLYG